MFPFTEQAVILYWPEDLQDISESSVRYAGGETERKPSMGRVAQRVTC